MIGCAIAGSCSSSSSIRPNHHLRLHLPREGAARTVEGGGGGRGLRLPLRDKRRASRRGAGSSSSSFAGRVRAAVVEEEEMRWRDGGAGSGSKSFYELLGIPEGGSSAEIKRAYKEMARRYHPDVCPSPERAEEYTRRFIEVQEAYETLSDPGRRARYDRDLARGLHLAFSAGRRRSSYYDEELEEKSQWRNRWQDQVAELKRRGTGKDFGNNMSWGARMRRQREESSTE